MWQRQLLAIERNDPLVTTLFATNVQFSPGTLTRIATALARAKHVERVDLANCNLGDDGAEAIASAIRENFAIIQLVLRRNKIGDRGGEALVSAVRTGYERLSAAHDKWSTAQQRIVTATTAGPEPTGGLQTLDLGENLLTSSLLVSLDALLVSAQLMGPARLQELVLDLNPSLFAGEDDGVSNHIAAIASSGLRKLNIAGCGLPASVAAESAWHLVRVRQLDLSFNPLQTLGIAAIGLALQGKEGNEALQEAMAATGHVQPPQRTPRGRRPSTTSVLSRRSSNLMRAPSMRSVTSNAAGTPRGLPGAPSFRAIPSGVGTRASTAPGSARSGKRGTALGRLPSIRRFQGAVGKPSEELTRLSSRRPLASMASFRSGASFGPGSEAHAAAMVELDGELPPVRVTVLLLDGVPIRGKDKATTLLFLGVGACNSLRCLSLRQCSMDEASATDFSRALRVSSRLSGFDLSSNRALGAAGATAIARAVADRNAIRNSISARAHGAAVQDIALSSCNIGDTGCAALAAAIRRSGRLPRSLVVQGNAVASVEDDGRCNITDLGAIKLAEAYQQTPQSSFEPLPDGPPLGVDDSLFAGSMVGSSILSSGPITTQGSVAGPRSGAVGGLEGPPPLHWHVLSLRHNPGISVMGARRLVDMAARLVSRSTDGVEAGASSTELLSDEELPARPSRRNKKNGQKGKAGRSGSVGRQKPSSSRKGSNRGPSAPDRSKTPPSTRAQATLPPPPTRQTKTEPLVPARRPSVAKDGPAAAASAAASPAEAPAAKEDEPGGHSRVAELRLDLSPISGGGSPQGPVGSNGAPATRNRRISMPAPSMPTLISPPPHAPQRGFGANTRSSVPNLLRLNSLEDNEEDNEEAFDESVARQRMAVWLDLAACGFNRLGLVPKVAAVEAALAKRRNAILYTPLPTLPQRHVGATTTDAIRAAVAAEELLASLRARKGKLEASVARTSK